MPGRGRVVEGERAAQQRTPRQVDRHERPRRPAARPAAFSAAATTNSAFGRPPLRAGAAARRDASARASATGSMPITSQSRVRRRRGEDEPAVAGADVREHAVGRGGSSGDLADVHLGDAAPGDDAHGRSPVWAAIVRPGRHRRNPGATASRRYPPYTSRRCPTSRSDRMSACRRRSTRGTRRRRSRAWRRAARRLGRAGDGRGARRELRRCPGCRQEHRRSRHRGRPG